MPFANGDIRQLFLTESLETEGNVTIRFRLAESQRQGSKKDKDEDEPM